MIFDLKVARQYLSAPLSSVASEREFKVGKRIVTDTRNRLLTENVENLIWVYYNQRALGFQLESIVDEYEKAMTSNNLSPTHESGDN